MESRKVYIVLSCYFLSSALDLIGLHGVECIAVSADQNVCTLPKEVGPCDASISRYFYDRKTQLCTKFMYGGCQGNGNNFETSDDCVRQCGCKAPAKTGPCKGYFPRYYYHNGDCLQFVYGGCQRNENNFSSKQDCRKACSKV